MVVVKQEKQAHLDHQEQVVLVVEVEI